MTNEITANNVVYDLDDFYLNDNRGYNELVTPGAGGSPKPKYVAVMIDLAVDAGKNMVTSSATSVSIGAGSKSFTMNIAMPYPIGAWVLAASAAAPTTKWMLGQVTARSGTSLTLNVPAGATYAGSGSAADWTLSVSGPVGATGATSPPDINGMTAETVLATGDFIPIYDVSASANRKVTHANLFSKLFTQMACQSNIVSDSVLQDTAFTGVNVGNVTGSFTLDYWSGHTQYATMTGNITTFSIINWPPSGQFGWITLELKQDATGGRTLALPAAYKTENGAGLNIDTTANAVNYIHFWTRDAGTTVYCTCNRKMS